MGSPGVRRGDRGKSQNQQARQLTELVVYGGPRDVTRIDTGEVRYAITEFDADALAQSVVADVSRNDADRVVLEQSGSTSAKARGDERRSWQVLVNLVSNALEFSPVDAPVRGRVLDTDTGEVHFAVEDRGPGVAPDDQERIFEKFSQGGGLGAEGTGLGLYIAQSLARGQGGRINVRSELTKGSTFPFVVPEAGGESRPAATAADTPAPRRQRMLRAVDSRRRRPSEERSTDARRTANG